MQTKFLKSDLLVQLVSIFDVFFALFVVAPLVVTFWATAFMLYDLFIIPIDPVISSAVSLSFGFCGQMVMMFYQDSIKRLLYFEKRKFVNILILKMYALVLAHTFVNFWRGVWYFVDVISTNDVGVVSLNIFQNITILMILGSFTNTLVPPFMMSTDGQQPEQYNMTTLLRKKKANGSFVYFMDCLATVFVGMMVAFVWRDLWFIQDNSNIFPDDPFYTALASLVFGYVLALFCFTVQSYVGILYEKYDNPKLFILYTFTMAALVSGINVWRGLWLLLAYFAGDNIQWILLLNTLAWVVLMITNCSFSLAGKDIAKDVGDTGKFSLFQTQYLSEMLFRETDKKSDSTLTISTRL